MRASNSHSKALLAFLAMGKKVKKEVFFVGLLCLSRMDVLLGLRLWIFTIHGIEVYSFGTNVGLLNGFYSSQGRCKCKSYKIKFSKIRANSVGNREFYYASKA